MTELKMWTNGTRMVVAATALDASDEWDSGDSEEFTAVPMDQVVLVYWADEPNDRYGPFTRDDEWWVSAKTAHDWIGLEGSGFIWVEDGHYE